MDLIISVTKTILLLFLYSLLARLHVLANANLEEITSLAREPPYNVCSNSNNSYAVDVPFQNNLRSLFSSISSNASVTKFSRSSSENGSGRLYGLHMCLNYKSTTLTDCKNCIDTATDDIDRLCPSQKEAVVWEDSCLLRYSDYNFFGKLDVSGKIPRANFKNVSEPERYKSVVNTILSGLIKRAVSDPANGLSATDETPFTNTDTVYALVQCTRDLSSNVCNQCLQDAKSEILSCCYFSRGARVYSRSCFLRYELYDFINGANESPASGGKQVKGQGSPRKIRMTMIATIVVTLLLVVLLAFAVYYLTNMKRTQKRKSEVIRQVQLHKVGDSNNTEFYHGHIHGRENLEAQEFHIDLKTIHLATDNFSDSNMLGQGGFGPVYKGVLSDGKEVAIKRLSSYSEQGNEEFTNEVLLIVKLQHKNLVRLLGFCVVGEEKLLVYEYMPNGSLDLILFDTRKREQLNWNKRIHIINGIAKGILYLHVDSRFRIIHRDLKASNILLDSDMNPKISDFGMARIFAGTEGETSTIKIVGTYGYMAPEYAMEGLYSIKSDVFSFGVLLLEILTGQRNSGFQQTKNATSLLAYAWQLWNEGNALELMDPLLTETCGPEEFLRCIHIGLLCVQEDAFDRPTMSSVIVMLKGETVTLQQPGKPPFLLGRVAQHHEINDCFSVNGLTVSDVLPR